MFAPLNEPSPRPRSRAAFIIDPIKAQLTQGATPERLALTIALGITLGVFPILGSTTALCGVVGLALRLNQPVIQLVNYLVYPLQLVLLIPFYRAGETLLGRGHLPLSIPLLIERFRANALRFLADFGMVGVGGIAVWLLLAPVAAAALYFGTRPALRALAARVG